MLFMISLAVMREYDFQRVECNKLKDQYIKATKQPYSFLYVDKPMKTVKRNFYGNM